MEQNLTGIYIIQGGRFVYVNPHFAELFRYATEELVGMEFRELVAEPDRALVEESVRKRIAGETESIQYSFRGRRKDGSWFDVGVHGSRSSVRGAARSDRAAAGHHRAQEGRGAGEGRTRSSWSRR